MAAQIDLAKIGSEGFALIDEYFGKKRINRGSTTVAHNLEASAGTKFWVTQQSYQFLRLKKKRGGIPEDIVETPTRGRGRARARNRARRVAPGRLRACGSAPTRGRARETSPELQIEVSVDQCYERFQKLKPPQFQGGMSEDAHDFLTLCHEMLEIVGMVDARGFQFVALQLRCRGESGG
ncbi:hypothetical protein MTR67_003373 [Solanum verrucosum]|uniref:Uncharacterized protein n=1 Tax=Solanum verrucosum TaxID=315347 RepID=A0AAF0PS09_SOLVR|nr:hypothetical protein MTR67_003373 [Solanum verrucosum]